MKLLKSPQSSSKLLFDGFVLLASFGGFVSTAAQGQYKRVFEGLAPSDTLVPHCSLPSFVRVLTVVLLSGTNVGNLYSIEEHALSREAGEGVEKPGML